MDGERHLNLLATLQRLLAVVDRCHEPPDTALAEEWHRAREEAHRVLGREQNALQRPPA